MVIVIADTDMSKADANMMESSSSPALTLLQLKEYGATSNNSLDIFCISSSKGSKGLVILTLY